MTHRRAVRQPGRSKAVTDVWRLKMTKENWVSGSNARLGQTGD
jgi:hypothetical protein